LPDSIRGIISDWRDRCVEVPVRIRAVGSRRRVATLLLLWAAVLAAAGCARRDAVTGPGRPGATPPLAEGYASWYGKRFQGRTTASGEPFDMNALTGAHRTLAFGTRVRVVHRETGREVVVRINDRGPFVAGRIIDLSREAARRLGILEQGVAPVVVYLAD
jgi:rare lipoprotein A